MLFLVPTMGFIKKCLIFIKKDSISLVILWEFFQGELPDKNKEKL